MYISIVGEVGLLDAGDLEGVANTRWMWRLLSELSCEQFFLIKWSGGDAMLVAFQLRPIKSQADRGSNWQSRCRGKQRSFKSMYAAVATDPSHLDR